MAAPIPLDVLLRSLDDWMHRLDGAMAAQDWSAISRLRCDLCNTRHSLHHLASASPSPPTLGVTSGDQKE
jgi:hypothetical protein